MANQICASCRSTNQREFAAEMYIHFPGIKALGIPGVLVFPAIFVCMDCGAASFSVPDDERRQLADGDDRGLCQINRCRLHSRDV